ncbi:type 4a pilus biogenesis protein PilO [Photobacterium sanguinicancri]|uniref:type 4a pilus biogenesis protein PilO n=1 Tax=Photobacterium sanguinicancri TaxID=875932 RepID=UPI0026E4186B|nr:type 4a pilus biogenesis protein PilO [Photobacterium sanguinicancri]MDO6499338.1 type 4a pilus biogenesis protein PilO [Photobacterium sanguinicancri]
MSQWQDLELDEILEWPFGPQCVVLVLIAGLLSGGGYWYWQQPLNDELEHLKQTEIELRTKISNRAAQVAALPKMQAQVEELNRRYQQVIKQLPEEDELASFLAGVNDVGVRNGLDFQRIEWAPTREDQWYYELPINMEVTGNYQQMGRFASSVAKLSRIVTLKDIDLSVVSLTPDEQILSLRVSASTYRFKPPTETGTEERP